MHFLRIPLIALIVLTSGIPAHGQEIGRAGDATAVRSDSLGRGNALLTSFDRNLNTYNWTGRLFVDTAFGGLRIGLRQNYTSNIIVLESADGSRRSLASNQENLALGLRQRLTDDLGVQVQWTSLVFSDDKAIGLSNAAGHSVLGGIEFAPVPFLILSPLVGYRWDNQGTIRERGLGYTLGMDLREVESDGYRFSGSGQFHEDRLDPRTLASHFGRIGVQKSFGGRTRDSLVVGYSRLRREFYTLADATIEARLDNLLSITNLLEYEVDRNILASLLVSVGSRGLDKEIRAMPGAESRPDRFNARIEEFRFDAQVQLELSPPSPDAVAGMVRMGFFERDERHRARAAGELTPALTILLSERNRQEETKDNFASRTSLSGLFSVPLSRSDRLSLSGGASILRYDTPSTENVEERDELLVAALVATEHRISPALEVGVRLEGTLSHIVYLLKERSANNNINRVLRLAPRTLFRPFRWLTSANALEVLANYTVYDFEEQVASIRSFSYRQFAWIDSTAIQLSARVGLHLSSYIKLYERGQLRWREFRERTENAFADRTFGAQLRFTPVAGTVFAIGWHYFSQSRYEFDTGEKQLTSFQRSTGPTCAVTHDVGFRGQINFRGWLERRHQPDETDRSLASMTLTVLWNF